MATSGKLRRLRSLPALLVGSARRLIKRLRATDPRSASTRSSLQHNPVFLQSLIDHLPVLVFVRALSGPHAGRICIWNRTAESITGYPAAQVLHRPSPVAFGAATTAALEQLDRRMLADPKVIEEAEVPFRRPDGELKLMHTISVPVFDAEGKPAYLLGIAEDITHTARQARALRTKQAELTAAYDASPLGLFQTDPDGRCTYVNRRYEKLSGLPIERALGNGWINAIHRQDRIKVFRAWRQSWRSSAAAGRHNLAHLTCRFVHDDGRIVWVSVRAAPVVVDGKVLGYSGTVDDITTRIKSEQALAASEQRLRTLADALPALVACVDADLRIVFCNRACAKAWSGGSDALLGLALEQVLSVSEYAQILPRLQRALAGEIVTFEREVGDGDGYRCEESTCLPQLDGGRNVIGAYLMVQDITVRKLEQHRLRQAALHDSLTGLLNREGFQSKLESAVERSRSRQSLIAVMYLDLDHFKSVNDTHGHHIGDLLLQAFAGRLSQALRATDTVARLGGDEFTVVMENLSRSEDAELIASKIVQTVQTPFVLEGINVAVGVSVGIAFGHAGTIDAETLLRRADAMLYDAKQDGRNAYRTAPPEDRAA